MKKIIILAELLLVLVFFGIGIFRGEEALVEKQSVSVEENQVIEEFKVTPGVYRVTVEAENLLDVDAASASDGFVEFNLTCATPANFRALLQNPVKMTAEETSLTYQFYVTSPIEAVQLQANVGEITQPIVFTSISVAKTSLGFVMLGVIGLIAFTFLNLLLYFRRLILEKKITLSKQVVVWVLAGSVLLVSSPVLCDYLPVPAGAPLSPLLGRSVLGFPPMDFYRMVMIGQQILTAVLLYLLCKKLVQSRYTALLGTVLFLLSPYRMDVIYGGGAYLPVVGSAIIAAFAMLVLCRIKENKNKKRFVVILGILAVLLAVYRLNHIVYEATPIYLYTPQAVIDIPGIPETPLSPQMGKTYLAKAFVVELVAIAGMYLLLRNTIRSKKAQAVGVILYMTCPHFLYVLYQLLDLKQALVLAILPWIYLVMKKLKWKWMSIVIGIGTIAVLLLKYYLPYAKAGAAFTLSDFFTMWQFNNGHPGLGLGLLLGVVLVLWSSFADGIKLGTENRALLVVAVVMSLLSTPLFGVACFLLSLVVSSVFETLFQKNCTKEIVQN